MLVIRGFGQLHDVHAGCCHIVHIQKLAARCAGTPNGYGRRVGPLGLMKTANERGNDVAVIGVVVVAGAIEVGGHDAAVVDPVACAVLAVVAFAELDAGNFGNGVGLIRWL